MPETIEAPSFLSAIGNSLKQYVFAVQDYSLLAFQSVRNLFSSPQYWTDTLEQMDLIGVGSIFIVATAAVSIGGVLVLNTASQLQRFGMAALTGDGVSLALVRELGPTITALLVAGRNASGMASELGSMVVTEQVDAMRALGTDPIRKLVTPRVVATVCMLPLLVALADFCGLGGGFIVAFFTLRLGSGAVLDSRGSRSRPGGRYAGNGEADCFRVHYFHGRLLSGAACEGRNGRRRPIDDYCRRYLLHRGAHFRLLPLQASSCTRSSSAPGLSPLLEPPNHPCEPSAFPFIIAEWWTCPALRPCAK